MRESETISGRWSGGSNWGYWVQGMEKRDIPVLESWEVPRTRGAHTEAGVLKSVAKHQRQLTLCSQSVSLQVHIGLCVTSLALFSADGFQVF